MDVCVGVAVAVGVSVGIAVIVGVAVGVSVGVAVGVSVGAAVVVAVAVLVDVAVLVAVPLDIGVNVGDGVADPVAASPTMAGKKTLCTAVWPAGVASGIPSPCSAVTGFEPSHRAPTLNTSTTNIMAASLRGPIGFFLWPAFNERKQNLGAL